MEPNRDPGCLRRVYVVSDLHLGGPFKPLANGRPFRLMSRPSELARFIREIGEAPASEWPVELVINGDFLDFLAVPLEGAWSPFRQDARQAAQILGQMALAEGDRDVFEALRTLLGRGQRLTILMGNHDIELSLPAVRAALAELLGADHRRFTLIHDGESYAVGDAVIEHGNRFDPYNDVDYDGLRTLRVRQSRRRGTPVPDSPFTPPLGSQLVASTINPIKERFPFIDLLKPETSAAVPLLLALDPRQVAATRKWAPLFLRSFFKVARGGSQYYDSDISAGRMPSDPLQTLLRQALGDDAGPFIEELGEEAFAPSWGHIAEGPARALPAPPSLKPQLKLLLAALRHQDCTATFSRNKETCESTLEGARSLAKEGGFRYVIFGHTHLAKDIDLGSGARYLNTGTWANLLRIPPEVHGEDEAAARKALVRFTDDMAAGALDAWVEFKPTLVRMDLGRDGLVRNVALEDYDSARGGLG